MNILSQIAIAAITPVIAFGGFLKDIISPDPIIQVQYVPEYIEVPSTEIAELNTGAVVPSAVALYTDSLAGAITANDTSFTLARGTDKTGTALASSTYGFIIDEGSANEEMVLANCTGTACTNVIRGISPTSGTSTVTALKKSHRRGAIVKMTDGPILITLSQILGGREGLNSPIKYDSSVATTSFTASAMIVNKDYVDSVAFNGASVINSNTTAKGVVEIATAADAANAGASGSDSGATLVIPASQASSTRVAGTGAGIIPSTDSNGTIDDDFLPRTIATSTTFTSTTTFTGGVVGIGSTTLRVYTANSTWTKPSSPTFKGIMLEMVGGGGGGGGNNNDSTTASAAGGGGAGGYCKKLFSVTALSGTSTVGIEIGGGGNGGSGGTGSTGGTSYFSTFASSTGGTGGTESANGGTGGVGLGCDLNIQGGGGASGDGGQGGSGAGGSNPLGGGGAGTTGQLSNGNPGGTYGGGGGGGSDASGGSTGASGGTGGAGVVIVTEYY